MMEKLDSQTMIHIYNIQTDTSQREPALIAFDSQTKKILAIGKEASPYLTSTNEQIQIACPFENGSITDFELAFPILQALIHKSYQRSRFHPLKIAICIPKHTNNVNKRVWSDILHQAGAKEITLSEEDAVLTKATLPSSYTLVIEIITPKQAGASLRYVPYQAYKFIQRDYEIDQITPMNMDWTITLRHQRELIQLTFPQTVELQIHAGLDKLPAEIDVTFPYILYQIQKETKQDSHLYFYLVAASYQIQIICDAMPVILSKERMP